MITPGSVIERLEGAPYGYPQHSLVVVARAGTTAYGLDRRTRGDWRRLHSFTPQEAVALAELVAAHTALTDDADPRLGTFSDSDEADSNVPF